MLGKLVVGEVAVGEVVTGEIVLGKLRWGNDLTPLVRRLPDPVHKTLACMFLFLIGLIM